MNTIRIEYPTDWKDYALIDSGDGEKLETYGGYMLVRPDPRAIWNKKRQSEWENADATYKRTDNKSGEWLIREPPPNAWHVSYKHLVFSLRPTEFKHVGVFPEQAVNWEWLAQNISGKPLNVLNLFAYTGGATMAAAAAGARVTHVDAAKSAIDWAHENVRLSGLADKPIRWIEDDVMKFVLREAKRNNTYDGIILDPPRFGRGSKGEVWKLENDLPTLINACKAILAHSKSFMLLNAYTADLSSVAIGNLLQTDEYGELALRDNAGRLLPAGIFARAIFGQRR